MPNSTADRTALRVEQLEVRDVPAVLIQLDYSYDTGFFAHNPQARATLERAAAELGASITADLAAVTPSGGNTWSATFPNPASGGTVTLTNPSIGANTIRVYVGARALGGGEAGYASTAGYSASGTPGWVRAVETRGWNGFAPWGGSIAFDTTPSWYFGDSAGGLGSQQLDFYSVAIHELGHVLGIGTSRQWQSLSSGGTFRGSNAMSIHGGPVPLTGDGLHWADHDHASLEDSIPLGRRIGWSALDAAALRDIGWTAGGASAAGVPDGTTLFVLAGPNGVFTQFAFRDGAITPTGKVFVPFPGFSGTLQQAFGDVDGDGMIDAIVSTTGPGTGVLAVVSGLDGRIIGGPRLANGPVLGVVAADLDGDGRVEIITREAIPGGSGVYVYSSTNGTIRPYALVSAFGEAGRAAVKWAPADVDHEGHGDAIADGCGCDAPVAPAEYGSDRDQGAENAAESPAQRMTCAGCSDSDGEDDDFLFGSGRPRCVCCAVV